MVATVWAQQNANLPYMHSAEPPQSTYFAAVLLFLYDGDFVTLTNQHRKVDVTRRFALDFASVDIGFILISRLFHKPILFQFPKRLQF